MDTSAKRVNKQTCAFPAVEARSAHSCKEREGRPHPSRREMKLERVENAGIPVSGAGKILRSLDLDYSYGTTGNLSCADSRMPRKLLSRLGTGCRRPSSVPEHNCIALTKCGQLAGTFPQLDRGQTKEQ